MNEFVLKQQSAARVFKENCGMKMGVMQISTRSDVSILFVGELALSIEKRPR